MAKGTNIPLREHRVFLCFEDIKSREKNQENRLEKKHQGNRRKIEMCGEVFRRKLQ